MDDPAVIRHFAKQVQTAETLMLLTLHTFVDAQATSDKLWNGFKDALLWELHVRAKSLLSGATEFVRAEEKQRELVIQETRNLLPPQFDNEELQAHVTMLPARYFQIQSAREVQDDLLLAHEFLLLQILKEQENPLAPVVRWHNEVDRGYSAVRVCTWDRAGLFGKIAGSLSAHGLNILSAQIFTRRDDIALDTFFVTDAVTGNLATAEQRDKFEALLGKVLTGEDADLHPLIARHKISRPLYQAYTGERIPTQIVLDNEASDTRTLIEIETEDRIGLLYAIAQAFTELQLDISGARISTEKGAAIDSFYVQEIGGGKILSPERQKAIGRRLRHAVHALDKTV
jgi:[protein-PII] uridylyltransferase